MKKKNKQIFALDIGTRSVIGLLLEKSEENYYLKEIVIHEHANRAMFDGQIHNIPEVGSLVKKVKKELEEKTKTKLKKVAVAAAGRDLITVKSTVSQELNGYELIKEDDILNLELKAAQEAQKTLIEKFGTKDINSYYCVGYSVTKYFLDESEIVNLLKQKGNKIGLEMVVAFLPKVVIESLQTVLTECKLELASITLEPIAAINAILPPTMRKLNLALVDVGAGTSDIAISKDGSVVAYGMVPLAGDEITEALCEKYLLDFNDGEILKRNIEGNEEEYLEFTDILGFVQNIKRSEIIDNISFAVKNLAQEIARKIIDLNSKSPQGVILIGGGSRTPLLAQYLAEFLGLPQQRVASQKASSIREIVNLPENYQGPEIITPLGIALTSFKFVNLGFIPVQVNGYHLNLLNLGENTVFDALLAAGIDANKLYGKPGLALTVEVNGKLKSFPGTLGTRAKVKVNGIEVPLDTPLKPKDKVEFFPAKDGINGKAKIKDLLPEPNFIKVNGKNKELPYRVLLDGKEITSFDVELKDNSKIYIQEITQIAELLDNWKIKDDLKIINLKIFKNGQLKKISFPNFQIIRGEKILELHEQVKPNDNITIQKIREDFTLNYVVEKLGLAKESNYLTVKVNGESIKMSLGGVEFKVNGKVVDLNYLLQDNDEIQINLIPAKEPILVDIFPEIDFNLTPPLGKTSLKILKNNQPAEYTSPLQEGDEITLLWE